MSLFRGRTTPIGLDLGERAVKAVQRSGSRTAGVAFPRDVEPGTPWSEAEARRLREVLSRRGFRGRDVVISAPKKATLTSVLALPPRRAGIPFAELARAELAAAHRREPEGLEVVSYELPQVSRPGEGVTVLATGCPHADADAQLLPLEAAGFHVVAMDTEAWALARVCGTKSATSDQVLAIADMGWSAGTLVLLHQGKVVYERQLSTSGLGALYESLRSEHKFSDGAIDYLLFEVGFEAEERGQDDDWRLLMKGRPQVESHFESFANELALSIRYAQHQYPEATLERVVISGGGAAVPGLVGFLAQSLEVRPDLASPEAAMGILDSAIASPIHAIAAGLALWDEAEAAPCAA